MNEQEEIEQALNVLGGTMQQVGAVLDVLGKKIGSLLYERNLLKAEVSRLSQLVRALEEEREALFKLDRGEMDVEQVAEVFRRNQTKAKA